MDDFVHYGRTKIHYKIERLQRKTLGITVEPMGQVLVLAPDDASDDKIQEMVIKRGSWITEQLSFFSNRPIPENRRKGLSGESFYFLGRQYRLKVIESHYDEVNIKDDRIVLKYSFDDQEDLKLALLKRWYFDRANNTFSERLQEYKTIFGNDDISIAIKKLKNSWGKFYPKNRNIVLNVELIVAPIDCIDYVIVHELCHGKVLNHGKEFDVLMSLAMPNWKILKTKLEGFSNGLSSLFFDT